MVAPIERLNESQVKAILRADAQTALAGAGCHFIPPFLPLTYFHVKKFVKRNPENG